MKINKAFEDYIDRAAPFAQPVLIHFRALVHKTCPEVEEKLKWGMPHFDYLGGPMAHMAAFKKHCAIGFWKAELMKSGKKLVEKAKTEEAMGHLGKITSVEDLPNDKVIIQYIKEAMELNEKGIKLSRTSVAKHTELKTPGILTKALSKNKKALNTFENFSPSHKREYIQWITEAKTEETRKKRLEQAITWMSEGKHRNWKY